MLLNNIVIPVFVMAVTVTAKQCSRSRDCSGCCVNGTCKGCPFSVLGLALGVTGAAIIVAILVAICACKYNKYMERRFTVIQRPQPGALNTVQVAYCNDNLAYNPTTPGKTYIVDNKLPPTALQGHRVDTTMPSVSGPCF